MPEPEIRHGKLVYQNGKPRVRFPNKKGELGIPTPFNEGELAPDLKKAVEAKIESDVDLELVAGQPRRIRPRGAEWREPLPALTYQPEFHNPYNFIPAPPRNDVPQGSELGDREPAGHDRYRSGRFSGVIQVRMTLETPLLLPDAARALEDDQRHKTFPVRTDAAGRPHVPPTAVKGVIRSAYEIATNSRLSVFHGHDDRLAYRMPAPEGLALVPARVEAGQVNLYLGTTSSLPSWQNNRWVIPGNLMYAAWLPRYAGQIIRYGNNKLPEHGENVRCWIEEFQHYRRAANNQFIPDFKYWRVRKIARIRDQLGGSPAPTPPQTTGKHRATGTPMQSISGWVCINNQNINRKHDERVFFSATPVMHSPLTDALKQAWNELIRNYQTIHEADLQRRKDQGQGPDQYLGDEPGKTAWSRHIYRPEDAVLSDGTLCYAKVNAQRQVIELYPVIIARKLFEVSPERLLHPSLRPASRLADSPRRIGFSGGSTRIKTARERIEETFESAL